MSGFVQEEGKLTKLKQETRVAFKVVNKTKDTASFECKQKGHMKKDCPNLKECNVCKEVGHDKNNCFYKSNKK